jgi:arabinose-5-phosphate isomerase
MRQAVERLAHDRGIAMVASNGRVEGVITAGDLTRLAERERNYLELAAHTVMTRNPKTIRADELGAAAVGVMERYGIMVLPVLDADGALVGVVHLHDLMRAGAV